MSAADFSALSAVGLNLHAVMELDRLPPALAAPLRADFDAGRRCRQLILIGNAGPGLWRSVQQAAETSADPIDAFSRRAVQRSSCRRVPGRGSLWRRTWSSRLTAPPSVQTGLAKCSGISASRRR